MWTWKRRDIPASSGPGCTSLSLQQGATLVLRRQHNVILTIPCSLSQFTPVTIRSESWREEHSRGASMCEAVLIREWKEGLPPERAPVHLFHWKHTTTPPSSGLPTWIYSSFLLILKSTPEPQSPCSWPGCQALSWHHRQVAQSRTFSFKPHVGPVLPENGPLRWFRS